MIRSKPRTTQTVSHRYRGIAAATCYSRATIKNDPSAGSPTETLLRLLVPPVDQVYQTLPRKVPGYPESYRNSM